MELREKDAALESVRVKASMFQSTHQQLDGQMAVLRGNVENNNANLSRIEEELRGQQDRSGGLESQITQTEQRVAQIDQDLADVRSSIAASQQKLVEMTASAQGLSKRFLELRTKQTELQTEIAGCEADIRALEENRESSRQRLAQLEEDSVFRQRAAGRCEEKSGGLLPGAEKRPGPGDGLKKCDLRL